MAQAAKILSGPKSTLVPFEYYEEKSSGELTPVSARVGETDMGFGAWIRVYGRRVWRRSYMRPWTEVKSAEIYVGGIVYMDQWDCTQYSVFSTPIPAVVQIWEGRGYTGGHNSQSHWDDRQEQRQITNLLRSGFSVCDKTSSGNTGGYYPKILFWKK